MVEDFRPRIDMFANIAALPLQTQATAVLEDLRAFVDTAAAIERNA